MVGPVTRVGDVIDALVALAEGVVAELNATLPDDEKLDMLDGPRVGYVMPAAICIGLTDGADRPGYSSTIDRSEGMGRRRTRETVTVRCLLTLSTGDNDPVVLRRLRTRATGILADLDDRLRDTGAHAEQVWQSAGLDGDTEWIPLLQPEGASINVLFNVVAVCLL